MTDQDRTEALQAQVAEAAQTGQALRVVGSGSKDFYGNPAEGEPLELASHRGVINYQPTELVLTARAGTPLDEIQALLADNGQWLAFDPPRFDGPGTLGGAVAAGLSGPGRPYNGAVRDMVLGMRLINGRAEVMRFGGEVMKNVAGYDVSRLNTGALGTLGAVLEVSVKVLPKPESTATLALDRPAVDCRGCSEEWVRGGRPVTGVAHDGEHLRVRLAGTPSAVAEAVKGIGGEVMEPAEADTFWSSLRDHQHPFFRQADKPVWRLSLPPGADPKPFGGDQFVDWGGQQVWLTGDVDPTVLRQQAADAGGSATLFRGRMADLGAFSPLDAVKTRLHAALKDAFDPERIFNPGRLYPETKEH